MKYNYLLSFFLLLVGSGIAKGQQGIVKGKIIDAVNRESLAGAAVQIVGSNTGAVANLSGDFQFYTAAGNHNLVVRYLGYQDTTVSITVQAGKVTIINFNLRSTSQNLSAVVITGTMQGQSKALNQQKNADNIKNIVSADQIGRFPDPNVAEALQRVPGVNIERDQGEGRYVLVRGLAPQFTNVSVNGEQIPSPEGSVRYVALDAIPSDQLASMEISKSLTPDMDGDAIGGSVNLITRTAQSKKANLSGSLAGGYNNLMEKTNVQGQLQYGQRFGKNDNLGIMLNTNYYQNRLGSDNWEYAPQDKEVELRDYQLTRTRLGLSSTIDYKFSPKHEVYVRGLYSKFTDREWRRRYVFAPEDEEIAKLTKDRYESQSILSINAGAKHTFAKFFTNYEVQYSYGEQDTPYDYEVEFIAGIPSTISFPTKNYPLVQATTYTDNTKYEFEGAEFGHTLAKDRNLTAKIDIGIPYKNGLIKFGGKVRAKRKSYSINANTFENQGGVPNLDAFAGEPVKDVFLGDRYAMGNPLDITRFNQYFNANPAQFELDVEGKAIDEALEAYEAEENVYAGYGMVRQQFNKLLILGGVRYEKTTVNYQSKDVVINAAGNLTDIRPVTGSSNYDFILPQLHFRYKVNEFTNVRAAATYTYARPNFSDIVPSQEINQEDNIATIGNPNLKPVSAVNLDLLGERYFGNVGVISAGLFHKRLDAFIYRRILFNSPYPLTGNPIVSDIDVQQAQNGNEATLTGFEVAYQGNLTFLPGFLKNFTLYANYTYTHSNADIQSRTANGTNPDEKEKLRLPGQAENVGNVSLGYEWKKLTARASMNFNGTYLSEIGATTNEDVFVKNRAQLDFSASYALSNRVRFFAECMNLTNQPFQTYMGSENTIIQREFYSWWSRVGIKFNL